jgi:predicted RNase H-like HicB family nuclease
MYLIDGVQFNEVPMQSSFVLEYWEDDGWLVGRLRGVPGVFSQGRTLAELEENVRDAYSMMTADDWRDGSSFTT